MDHRIVARIAALAAAWAAAAAVAGATPAQMQAIMQEGSGGPEVLHLRSIAVPEPAAGQVLIRVYAASVNPIDWKMRSGYRPAVPPPAGGAQATGAPPPGDAGAPAARIPGLDVAGVVEKVGQGVTQFKAGDAVFSMIGRGIGGLNGAYAQYALAPVDNVVAKPPNLSYAEAAGLGTTGMTAARILARVGLADGQRLLVTGVAGGVGSAVAQIARARGAHVIGTASARHLRYLGSIGVEDVIDYTQGPFEERIKDVDVVVDTVGGDTAARALKTLRRGGSFGTVAGRADPALCTAAGVNCAAGGPPGSGEPGEGELLRQVAALAASGRFHVHVDRTFPLARAGDAQEYNRAGHTEGKVILVVDARQATRR
ncbi:MAG: NADP-dependent oxidoreductase [Steroidobacteraceae bacterium]